MTTVVIGDNTGDDYPGTEDTYLNAAASTTNYGSNTGLQLYDGIIGSNDRTVLLSFSGLSSIPSGISVNSATLAIYKTDTDAGTSSNAVVKRCLRNWVEGEATYNNYSSGNAWTEGGGQSDGNDRSATVSVTIPITGSSGLKSASDAQLASDVQDIINGVLSNYGWVIECVDVTGAPFHNFGASEGTDGQRPYATIDYSTGGGLVTLTGVQAAGNIGALVAKSGSVISLFGAQSIGSIGTLQAKTNFIASLNGVSASGHAGDPFIITHASFILDGTQSTGHTGILTISVSGGISVSLSGVSAISGIGDVSTIIGQTIALQGTSSTASIGILDITGHASVSINGVEITGSVGTIVVPGNNVNIPSYRIYTVEHENRTFLVLEEDRTFMIEKEDTIH